MVCDNIVHLYHHRMRSLHIAGPLDRRSERQDVLLQVVVVLFRFWKLLYRNRDEVRPSHWPELLKVLILGCRNPPWGLFCGDVHVHSCIGMIQIAHKEKGSKKPPSIPDQLYAS